MAGRAGIVVSPNDTAIYVANAADNTVSVVNRATDRIIKTIKVGNRPGRPALWSPRTTRPSTSGTPAPTPSR